jgi:hypothetical protein
MIQLEFDYDDLTPAEQGVYLKAAQRLLNSAEPDDAEDAPCAGCGALPDEDCQAWCPMLIEGDAASA